MDFLKQLGYTEQDINDIKDYNYDYTLDNIIINKEKVEDIIEYLLSIGIERNTIKEKLLLMNMKLILLLNL